MCLILFAYKKHPKYQLIIAANRDEFYKRPTAPAHFWEDAPEILAGRDLEKMGTWMGVTKDGRFSALTNYRNPRENGEGKKSRGELVSGALQYQGDLKSYMEELAQQDASYPGYNLLAGDLNELFYYSNIGKKLMAIEPGIYGVSNHLLNSNWPKVQRGKEGLERIIALDKSSMIEDLFSLLANAEQAPDEILPKTGVSLEMERMLSPLFIKSEEYGTRSSTVVFMSAQEIHYVERVFSNGKTSTQEFKINL